MLLQTQAPHVAQQYDAFVARFPTPTATAAERPGAVIEAWGRLGDPRRARWLWDAAPRVPPPRPLAVGRGSPDPRRRLARRPGRVARRRPLHGCGGGRPR